MLSPLLQPQPAVPWTPLPIKRTAIPLGCPIVAEMPVAANCPLTLLLLTTRHVDALDSDESAAAGTTSASASVRMATLTSVPGRLRPASRGGEAPQTSASELHGAR